MDLKANLKPTVVSNPHPLIGADRAYYYEGFKEGETLGEYVTRVGVKLPKGSIVVLINGCVALHDWKQYILQEGDDIVFRSSAHGGGGARKVLRIVAMVALTIVSAGYGGVVGAALGFTNAATAAAVGGALIMMAGTILINALLPPPKPQVPALKDKEQSSTYGISAGRNQANPYGPMLLVFGRHKVVPFLASKPYTTFVGDNQYLQQAFHFGLQPDLILDVLRIGDTNIEEYQDVEVNRSLHDGKLSLIAGNVDVLDGFELSYADGWIARTTPLDTEHISADIACNLYSIDDKGNENSVAVEIEAEYRKVGDTSWRPLGGYSNAIAPKYWSLGKYVTETYEISRRETDYVETRATWQQVQYGSVVASEHIEGEQTSICHTELKPTASGSMVEVQVCETFTWRYINHPARSGRPWRGVAPDPYSGYAGTGITNLAGSNPQKPTRYTIEVEVERGQYEVRFKKRTIDMSSSRSSNKVSIAQIRCTQTDEADYTGQLRLAVSIKASSQLNGAIDTFNAIASAKCPVWNGSAWVEQETSNPAWWFLWWARGKRDANYRRLFGECLPDNRIDIEGIKAWAAFCDAKNLTFNWVLDRKMSIEEVYYTIARAGRASTTWQTGKRGIIWDSANTPVTTLLTPANIIAGSFNYKVINAEVADEIVVNYYDKTKNWEKASVRQKVPNTQQTNNPITLDLEGCTDENQAGREANLLAASQHYHRKQYQFEMDIEGAVLARGDVAQLTHDLTSFTAGGRLVSVSGDTLTLDYDVGEQSNAWMTLRSPFNQLYSVRVNANGNTVTLIDGWEFGEVGNAEDWIYQYDPVKTPGIKLQIKSVVPQSNGNVKFEAIEYVDAYYDAEDDVYLSTPVRTPTDLPAIHVLDVHTVERVIDEVNGATEVTFIWSMSEMANANVVVYRDDEVLFTGRIHGYSVAVNAKEGDTLTLELIPFAPERISRTFRHSVVVIGTNIHIPAPENLTVVGGFTRNSVSVQWDKVVQASGYEVQVLSGATVLRTVPVGDVLTYTYGHVDMLADGGAVRALTFKVRALGHREAKSLWSEVSVSNPQIGALQGVVVTGSLRRIVFSCHQPPVDDFGGYLLWLSDDPNFVPTLNNVTFEGRYNQYFFEQYNNAPLEIKDYYVWCAGYDNFGKDSLNISGSFIVRPLAISADMIEDGSLTLTKFADGIKIPLVVEELPTTGSIGDLVVLQSTGVMHRWDGTQWLTQEVVIEDGSVTAAKIATGAVGADQIASNSITTQHMLANSISGSVITANTLHGDKVVVGTLNGDRLVANSVSAEKIDTRGLTIKNDDGDVVFSAGNGLDGAYIQNATVGSLQLANGAVGSLHIEDLSVDTIKIKDNAVTVSIGVESNTPQISTPLGTGFPIDKTIILNYRSGMLSGQTLPTTDAIANITALWGYRVIVKANSEELWRGDFHSPIVTETKRFEHGNESPTYSTRTFLREVLPTKIDINLARKFVTTLTPTDDIIFKVEVYRLTKTFHPAVSGFSKASGLSWGALVTSHATTSEKSYFALFTAKK